MLIEFSLLNGTRRLIECNPNDKIADILPKIIGSFQLEKYKTIQLIYKGRKIKETDEIKSLGYVEGQMIIVNAQGEKPIESSSSQQGNTSSNTPAIQPPPAQPAPPSTKPQPDRPPPENNIQNQQSKQISPTNRSPPVLLPDPEKWESNLQSLLDMGFDEDLSIRALVQAYNQPERAVELIASDQVKQQDFQSTPPQTTESLPSPPISQLLTSPAGTISNSPREDQNSQPDSFLSRVTDYLLQHESTNNSHTNDLTQRLLPDPQVHPLPDVQNQPHQEDLFLNPTPEANTRQILEDSLPTDQTVEPDQELDTIRSLILADPKYIDNVIDIIQENSAEDDDYDNSQNQLAAQIRANPKLLMHLIGFRKTDICNVPDNYTDDDIAHIRHLHGLGEFTWEQVMNTYEDSEMDVELAESMLLSLNELD